MIFRQLEETLAEYYHKIPTGMKDDYPNFHKFKTQIEIHASVYPVSLKTYHEEVDTIDEKYYTYGIDMYPHEALERLQAILKLAKNIGTIQLNKRYWNPYQEEMPPDDINLDCFAFTTTNDSPLLDKLSIFYESELEHDHDWENRSESMRKREAMSRAKNAVGFYEKYQEYKKSNFDARRIEEIFGIGRADQNLLNYWINKLLPSGLIVSIFTKAGGGKTNFSSFLMQMILVMKPTWTIVTNIPLIFSPWMGNAFDYSIDNIIFVSSLADLMEANANLVLKDRVLVICLLLSVD